MVSNLLVWGVMLCWMSFTNYWRKLIVFNYTIEQVELARRGPGFQAGAISGKTSGRASLQNPFAR